MIEEELRRALAALVDGLPPRQAAGAVERLMDGYRAGGTSAVPVLRDRADVVAYAAYRMPATFAAVASALGAFTARTDEWRPGSHLDVGGGTGAAVWAAADVWDGTAAPADAGPEGGSRRTTVLDRSEPALALGRELADASAEFTATAALRAAEWRRFSLTASGEASEPGGPALPAADLVTVSYVLGELAERDRRALVEAAARAGRAVVVTEPGTPDGHARITAAREQLTAAGLRVLAPCPHSAPCPMVPGEDWCHFAARVSRSSLHRQVKGGSLPYEDEKFSYVAAADPAIAGEPAEGRIVRRPQKRKGQVLLELCTAGEGLRSSNVTKRHGAGYRAARDAKWGDAWPPDPGRDPDRD
ncbi:small ribosomal subunit Rsm22 family protein [Streptomyces winkii]|uniref:small ribosomal subunit Rsm22 family protein n=1 Tax=Streptomyces winkii TaxID=3051178 RepID=UPI0028D2D7BA|nr:small ribosomal subunit Rsm22 family protein [Streptomyces sp. DSM 40971]